MARMTDVLTRILTEAADLCHTSMALSESYKVKVAGLESAAAKTQLQVLRELARHAEVLGGQVAARGVVLPYAA